MSSETDRVSVVIDRGRFTKLVAFVEWGIDMQLADVRDLLRLPLPKRPTQRSELRRGGRRW
jgi:hypothetical protein